MAVRRYVVFFGLLTLANGCVTYHGKTEISTRTEVVVLSSAPPQVSIAGKVQDDMTLAITLFKTEVQEKAEIEKKKIRYKKYNYEPRSECIILLPVCMVVEPLVGPYKGDEPYVPVLSRLACALPGFKCSVLNTGEYIVDESETVMRRWPETNQKSVSARLKVEGAGRKLEAQADSLGHARVPLQEIALAALLAGTEQATLLISLLK